MHIQGLYASALDCLDVPLPEPRARPQDSDETDALLSLLEEEEEGVRTAPFYKTIPNPAGLLRLHSGHDKAIAASDQYECMAAS